MEAKKIRAIAYAALERHDFRCAEEEAGELLLLSPDDHDGHLIRLLARYHLHSIEGLSHLELDLSSDPLFSAALRTATKEGAEALRSAASTAERRSSGLHDKYAALAREIRALPSLASISASTYHSYLLGRDGEIGLIGDNGETPLVFPQKKQFTALAASDYHALALDSHGRVYATGASEAGQCRVRHWEKAEAVAVGFAHSLALTPDGRVLAVGDNRYGQCNTADWRDVKAIAAGSFTSYGLTQDGRVLSVGRKEFDECKTDAWQSVSAIYASDFHIVGLCEGGRLLATGRNDDGQCEVSGIEGAVSVALGPYHTLALLDDGRVRAVGRSDEGQCNVSDWYGITEIAAGRLHSVGLTTDGRVLAVGDNGYGQCGTVAWRSAIAIAAGADHTVALTAAGRVLGIGRNSYPDGASGKARGAGQAITKRLFTRPMLLPLLREALSALTAGRYAFGLELLGRLSESTFATLLSARILDADDPDALLPIYREHLTEVTASLCRIDACRRELGTLHRFELRRKRALQSEISELERSYLKPRGLTE